MTELQIKIARIRQLDKDIIPESIEDAERYKEIATACTPRYENDGSQHTVSGNNKEKAMLEYASAKIKIDDLQDELADLKMQVKKDIDLISDDKQRRFAKLYYIDQMSQKAISHKSHYAYSTVRNIITDFNKNIVHQSTQNAIE